jgi:hypothetical protein
MIVKNQISGSAATLDIATNSYAINAFAVPNTSVEVMLGISVTSIIWTGDWVVKNGNTVVWQTPAGTAGQIDLGLIGAIVSSNSGNLSVTTAGSASSIALRVSKYSYNTAGI